MKKHTLRYTVIDNGGYSHLMSRSYTTRASMYRGYARLKAKGCQPIVCE